MPDLSNDSTRRVYHGTARLDFTCFDIAASGIYNIGLHFGTRTAAESRLAYLREENPSANFRILACELTLENPLRVDDLSSPNWRSSPHRRRRVSVRRLLERYGYKYYTKECLCKAN